ncbi:MAG: Eco57I restriction-modification methylase domain-containing protein [Candidatus Rehaiarchaeum fermentans]|nr:SAM-dependent methyltransferase [Candidatus Rehaiarchaeum fermentans]
MKTNTINTKNSPLWLTPSERVKLGAFYTPSLIVSKVLELVRNFRSKAVLLDPAGGCGAFIKQFTDWNYRVADIDLQAVEYLKKCFNPDRVFLTDALHNITRSKYNIAENDFLVIIGNPPYNDWTSFYKKGKKGSFSMDKDIFDRDLGIAFLKAMDKLRADVICVLHPLSYLVKRANFQRLNSFFTNYTLKRAFAFPSYLFQWTSCNLSFPIVIALYMREQKGFSWENLVNFSFEFLDNSNKFRLSEIETTDGLINKYPRHGISPIELYFITFRDINSLLRNRDFFNKPSAYTIPITWENFPLYAYLVALKHYILENQPKHFWFYKNFSPLIDKKNFFMLQNAFIHYALLKSKAVSENIKKQALKKFAWNGTLEVVNNYFRSLFTHVEGC